MELMKTSWRQFSCALRFRPWVTATKVPRPRSEVMTPSSFMASSALSTVCRATPNWRARCQAGHLSPRPRPLLTAGWNTTTATAASGIWQSCHRMNTTVTSPQANTPTACCRHGSNEFVLDLGSTLNPVTTRTAGRSDRPEAPSATPVFILLFFSSSAKSPGWGKPSLQKGGAAAQIRPLSAGRGPGLCPSRNRATQRLTGGHAGLYCFRKRFATRWRSVANSNSSSWRS